ncbi:hypothetical protein OPV22_008666 [Ensete ventricosum]|uniref:Uncharacterized protein n=1 Tax=Ensete ventricosum TaxID=4639 RepID=A0AAV8PQB1_ENSVE|nr:hypothetical protein OPV22_008666 [Ensete ventricosum]
MVATRDEDKLDDYQRLSGFLLFRYRVLSFLYSVASLLGEETQRKKGGGRGLSRRRASVEELNTSFEEMFSIVRAQFEV